MNNMKVLCVDDNLNHLKMIAELVREKDYEVFTAQNVQTAFDVLKNEEIDCIVTDYDLCDNAYDGIDFYKEAVNRGYNNSVIFITSKTEIFNKSGDLSGDVRVVIKSRSYGQELAANLHNCFAKRLKEVNGSYSFK